MLMLQRRVVNNQIDNTVTFQGLNPSTSYRVSGVVRHGDLESTATTQTAQTGKVDCTYFSLKLSQPCVMHNRHLEYCMQ